MIFFAIEYFVFDFQSSGLSLGSQSFTWSLLASGSLIAALALDKTCNQSWSAAFNLVMVDVLWLYKERSLKAKLVPYIPLATEREANVRNIGGNAIVKVQPFD